MGWVRHGWRLPLYVLQKWYQRNRVLPKRQRLAKLVMSQSVPLFTDLASASYVCNIGALFFDKRQA